jgi:hypothetical protein
MNKNEKLFRKWQKRLGLSHWELHFRIVSQERMDELVATPGVHGCVQYKIQHSRAVVFAVGERHEEDPGMEFTIVHELLHCLLSPFCGELAAGSIAQTVEEQVINRLTSLLTGDYPKYPKWIDGTEEKSDAA